MLLWKTVSMQQFKFLWWNDHQFGYTNSNFVVTIVIVMLLKSVLSFWQQSTVWPMLLNQQQILSMELTNNFQSHNSFTYLLYLINCHIDTIHWLDLHISYQFNVIPVILTTNIFILNELLKLKSIKSIIVNSVIGTK